MSSKDKKTWDELFAFSDEAEMLEHEADMLSLKIALEITNYLGEKGISKKELAAMIGKSPAYITQILRGDKRINMVFLAKIVQKLNVNLDFRLDTVIEGDAELLADALKINKDLNIATCNVIDFRTSLQKYELKASR
ncbi:MAG: helix-turn-helix transcriptional regulator [Candidatus Cloacimonetes bacterium]|jgi:transcriptional regulator with XRE-family HTH domain|nr:helix-turn-helix transcriptional regulator [Candidatus Cloacimonadota bacterium]MDD3234701.1 helix-turn-helix transcriptional regulator [Candidatus Cloacimonadota bacterium]